MKRTAWAMTALLITLSACSEEASAPDEAAPVEQGGEAAGEVEGGTISDAMIPLESLRSQSPTIQRRTTTVTTSDGEGGTSTTVETTTVTTSAQSEAPAPAPPEPPAAPGGRL